MLRQFTERLAEDGFAIAPGVLSAEWLRQLQSLLVPLLKDCPAAGIRGIADKIPQVRELERSAGIRALVEPVLGPRARLVRSILFNKTQEANWQVAWHQDLAIAVSSKAPVEGFVSWSEKEGVAHVQPPTAVLEQMLTVRLHLDPADETNGALWVSPGSHRFGRIPAGQAAAVAESNGKFLCSVAAGDALLLRPLILHASRKATSDLSRRVIHLEFAGVELPEPLSWHESSTETRVANTAIP